MEIIIISLPIFAVLTIFHGLSHLVFDKESEEMKYSIIVAAGLIFAYILFGFATYGAETMLQISLDEILGCGGLSLIFGLLIYANNNK